MRIDDIVGVSILSLVWIIGIIKLYKVAHYKPKFTFKKPFKFGRNGKT